MTVRAKKHLGQHFLKSSATAAKIAAGLSGKGYEKILEVGPGMGILTQHLLPQEQELWVAEIDRESVIYLEQHFPALAGRIIPADFLQLNLKDHFGQAFALVGNYPYNISTQIVFKMLENRSLIPEMVGMFQKEVADRLVAEPGSKIYGITSVLCAAWYEREYLFTVEPEEFNPPPKVRSAVIAMRRKASEPEIDEALFYRVVKSAFNQRRKTLRNALKSLNLPLEALPASWLSQRAEQLSYQQFLEITRLFSES
jgi:16S rRNA (adenine1518-N6/adenine1519-N6)-dimethyltransferase